MRKRTKALLVDILGFACIIAAPFLGWIPGPGGIPLLIIGLSLLATNHEWAERLLQRVKDEVGKAAKNVSEADPATKWGIDIMSVIFITVAVLLLVKATGNMLTAAGISLVIAGTIMFFTNQNRYLKIWNKLRRRK